MILLGTLDLQKVVMFCYAMNLRKHSGTWLIQHSVVIRCVGLDRLKCIVKRSFVYRDYVG